MESNPLEVIAICHSRPITARARGGSVTQVLDHDKPGGGRRGPDDPWFTLVVPAAVATELWSTLSASPSVVTAGEAEWQTLRIRRGENLAAACCHPSEWCMTSECVNGHLSCQCLHLTRHVVSQIVPNVIAIEVPFLGGDRVL